MSYSFDGVDDKIDCGSDTSIDGSSSQVYTWGAWVLWTPNNTTGALLQKWVGATRGVQLAIRRNNDATNKGKLTLAAEWSTTQGNWYFTTTLLNDNLPHHIWVTYDAGATGNNPSAWIDGVSQSVTTNSTPAGSFNNDAASTLLFGLQEDSAADYKGELMAFLWHLGSLTQAQGNFHRWYGRPAGTSVTVNIPIVINSLTNQGTGTANGTATGAVVSNKIPRIERCLGASMGCGR